MPLLIINSAAILFCAGALAVFLGWLPASLALSEGMPVPPYPPASPQLVTSAAPGATEHSEIKGKASASNKCAGCGVIVSMQAIERLDEDAAHGTAGARHDAQVKSTRTHEIVIRLTDGSRRVMHDASPERWRLRERVIVIDGARPSSR